MSLNDNQYEERKERNISGETKGIKFPRGKTIKNEKEGEGKRAEERRGKEKKIK